MRKVSVLIPNGRSCSATETECFFHQWGQTARYYLNDLISNTVAIVEDPTGKIWTVDPDQIKFLNEADSKEIITSYGPLKSKE